NMTIHNPTPFMNPVASYLQQLSNLIAQPTIPDPVGEPIKKLTSLMEELVVSLKSNSRGNQQRNRNNAPFRGNR
ncbi:30278_t:CDS:1, partial [Racocetra persica]